MDSTSDTNPGPARDGKTAVQVQILGHQLSIRSDADEKYILEVAQYVDRKMREVTEKLPVASVSKVAMLASLNIADELFKERSQQKNAGSQANGRAAELIKRLDEVLDEAR